MSIVDRFAVVVHPLSDEDGGGFVAVVPDLPGCMGDGDTAEAAVADAKLAAAAWIEATVDLGKEVPEAGSVVKRVREREDAMLHALRALLKYADHADNHIGKLEARMNHLIHLLEAEHKVVAPEMAVFARASTRLACH